MSAGLESLRVESEIQREIQIGQKQSEEFARTRLAWYFIGGAIIGTTLTTGLFTIALIMAKAL